MYFCHGVNCTTNDSYLLAIGERLIGIYNSLIPNTLLNYHIHFLHFIILCVQQNCESTTVLCEHHGIIQDNKKIILIFYISFNLFLYCHLLPSSDFKQLLIESIRLAFASTYCINVLNCYINMTQITPSGQTQTKDSVQSWYCLLVKGFILGM